METRSCAYECHVMHRRLAPRTHGFSYRIFLLALDLDELPALPRRLRLFALNRPNLYSLRERDYLPTGEVPHAPTEPAAAAAAGATLKERVVRFLAARGVDLAGGRVLLLTLPRIFGYAFNPVSFYFCFDARGEPVAALAEVTNTFREIKPYFLGPDSRAGHAAEFRRRAPKQFYVSPFSDVDVAFDFALRVPGERLDIRIDDFAGEARTLVSTLRGERRALTGARLAWWTIKYPLLTLRVIGLIQWHAARLWLKRLPWFPKAARPEGQRDLYRPHRSIAGAPTAPAP